MYKTILTQGIRLVVFSSFENKYKFKGLKSILMENYTCKVHPFNILSKFKKKYQYYPNLGKIFKFKTNLLSFYGDKLSFLIHISFFVHFLKKIDKNLIKIVSLLNESRKKSYIDLKLSVNCLEKILETNSNKNLYFREEYEMLKTEYFLNIRMINLSFSGLKKLFIFSKKKSNLNFLLNSNEKMNELMNSLVYRFTFFNNKNTKAIKTLKFSKLNSKDNIYDLKYCLFKNGNFFFEEFEEILKNQKNWAQSRFYLKKIIRKKSYNDFYFNFKKLDFFGAFSSQKFYLNNERISFDVYTTESYRFFYKINVQ